MVNFLCRVCGRYFDVKGNEIRDDGISKLNSFVCDDCQEEENNQEGVK